MRALNNVSPGEQGFVTIERHGNEHAVDSQNDKRM